MIKKRKGIFFHLIMISLLLFSACSSTDNTADEVMQAQAPQQAAELIQQPESEPVSSRSNPLPPTTNETVEGLSFAVTEMVRPADDLFSSEDQYGFEPDPESEYVLLTLNVACRLDQDERCTFDLANVKLVCGSGIVYPVNWDMIVGTGDYLDSTELFGGAQISGSLLFSVNQEEQELIFLYDSFYEYPFFMSLPEPII